MSSPVVYMKLSKSVIVKKQDVRLADIASLFTAQEEVQKRVEKIPVYRFPEAGKSAQTVISSLYMIKQIQEKYPEISVTQIGEADTVVLCRPEKKRNRLLEAVKTGFVALIIFAGSAFTIMTFNEDVSVGKIFAMFYELVTGKGTANNGIMEIAYAIGLPIGIILFFNHFSKAKMSRDPTPLEVQTRTAEKEMYDAIIEDASRTKEEVE